MLTNLQKEKLHGPWDGFARLFKVRPAILHSAFFILPSPRGGLAWLYLGIANSRCQMANCAAGRPFWFQLSAFSFQLLPECGFGRLSRSAASISTFYFLLSAFCFCLALACPGHSMLDVGCSMLDVRCSP
jgi:hypothetical protein